MIKIWYVVMRDLRDGTGRINPRTRQRLAGVRRLAESGLGVSPFTICDWPGRPVTVADDPRCPPGVIQLSRGDRAALAVSSAVILEDSDLSQLDDGAILDQELIDQIDAAIQSPQDQPMESPARVLVGILQALAEGGRLRDVSLAVRYFLSFEPRSMPVIMAAIPGIVANRYFLRSGGLDADRFSAWTLAHGGWFVDFMESVDEPSHFARAVDAVLDRARSEY